MNMHPPIAQCRNDLRVDIYSNDLQPLRSQRAGSRQANIPQANYTNFVKSHEFLQKTDLAYTKRTAARLSVQRKYYATFFSDSGLETSRQDQADAVFKALTADTKHKKTLDTERMFEYS
jgi:hypothetical protein